MAKYADQMKSHWMEKAVKPKNKGVFKAAAQRAGKSTAEFAAEHAHDSGTLGKRARLAQTFAKMRNK